MTLGIVSEVNGAVMHGDLAMLDRQLMSLLVEAPPVAPRLLLCQPGELSQAGVAVYADYLCELLGGTLDEVDSVPGIKSSLDDLITAARTHDLLIFAEPNQPLLQQWLFGPAACRLTEAIPTSMLVARNPRWPLKKILMVTRAQEGVDEGAVQWTIQLAQASQSVVTVLALVPGMSVAWQKAMTAMPGGMADWLTTNTPLGRQVRRIAQQLVTWEIDGTLRFRQGSPDQQIQAELDEADYDLLILGAEPVAWWARRLLGDLVGPLLRWIDRPVLVAKTAQPK